MAARWSSHAWSSVCAAPSFEFVENVRERGPARVVKSVYLEKKKDQALRRYIRDEPSLDESEEEDCKRDSRILAEPLFDDLEALRSRVTLETQV